MINLESFDKSRIYTAFSTSKGWISGLIQDVTGSQFSHAFFLHFDARWDAWVALGETAHGWGYEPAKLFDTISIVDVPTVDLWRGLRLNARWLGASYDYTGLFGMTFVELAWHIFKRRIRNPWHAKNAWFCSAIATQVFLDSGAPLELDAPSTDPKSLHNALLSLPGAIEHT